MENHSGTVKADVLRSLIISNNPSGSKPSSGRGLRDSKDTRTQDEVAVLRSPIISGSAPAIKALSAGRIRLTHSAPKEKLPTQTEKDSEGKDSPSCSNKPERKAVYFNIAQRKDILPLTTVSLRRDVNIKASDNSMMKPQTAAPKASPRQVKPPPRARSESPNKKKTQVEVHFKPEKVSQAFSKKDNHSKGVLLHSEENSGSDRKVVSVAHCEVFALSDKSNRLNRPSSKSSNSINVVPRPVAAFPSKPIRSSCFMTGRRRSRVDTSTSSSTTAITGQILSEDSGAVHQSELSVYSREKCQKDGTVVPNSRLPSDKTAGVKLDHRYGVLNSSVLMAKTSLDTTPVPYNSCKTSMVGSDIFMVHEPVMGTLKDTTQLIPTALESLFGDGSEAESDKLGSKRINTATTKTLGTTINSKPTTRETSKYSSVTKDSKSSTNQKGKPLESKHNSAQERYKSIIMDIYKKKGKDVQMIHNPMWKQGLSRSSSFGSKDEVKPVRGSGNKRQSSVGDLSKIHKGPKITKEGHIGGKKINPKPLSILGSKGGRDIIFSPTKGKEKPLELQPQAIILKVKDKSEPEERRPGKVIDESKEQEKSEKEPVLCSKNKPSVPERGDKDDDINLEELDGTDESDSSDTECDVEPLLQGTSSFKKINAKLSTKMVEYGRESAGEAMFTASHYVDFQHTKFNGPARKQPIKIPGTSYTDDVKSKFLKVKVGGTGDGKSVAE